MIPKFPPAFGLTLMVLMSICVCNTQGFNVSDLFDKAKYTKIRPQANGAPVAVGISAYILDVYNIDEKNHEFTVQMYLRQTWVEDRLKYDAAAGVTHIELDQEHSKKIWVPDTLVVNERRAYKNEFTVGNEVNRIYPNGKVLRSIRATITSSCFMDLKWFPFDTNPCTLKFESFGGTTAGFYYTWLKHTNNETKLAISQEAVDSTISKKIISCRGLEYNVTKSGIKYSQFSIELMIRRKPLRYLQDVFFPSIALPIIAFMTMSVGDMQFRVLLSTLCMLGIIIFTSLLAVQMPQVSYQTALDFYVFNSSVMVFNVVVANFLMYHILKYMEKAPSKKVDVRMHQLNGGLEETKDNLKDTEFLGESSSLKARAFKIGFLFCRHSKYTSPVLFVVFNIIYWPVVLFCSNFSGPQVLSMVDYDN